MLSLLLGSLLMGGSVYINGVKANSLRNFDLEDVDVRIDEQGDVYITAPNLIVEVAGRPATEPTVPAPTAPTPTAPTPTAPTPTAPTPTAPTPTPTGPAPVAPTPATPAPVAPAPAAPATPASAPKAPAAGPAAVPTAPPVSVLTSTPSSAVPAEAWWLVIEDNGSTGQQLEVQVNGQLVTLYQSGGQPVMIDLAVFLHPGENQVDVNALATPAVGGGVLHVYIAPGENQAGSLVLDEPVLVFSRRASDDPAGATFHRTLSIP